MTAGERAPCPICGAAREEFDRHAHCTECGALIHPRPRGVPIVHAPTCTKLKLLAGQRCPMCARLLAAGAWCPEHGDPTPRQGGL